MSLRLCLYVYVSTSISLRLYLYVYVCRSLSLCPRLYASVSTSLSLFYVSMSLSTSLNLFSVSMSLSLRPCLYVPVSTILTLISVCRSLSTSLCLRLYLYASISMPLSSRHYLYTSCTQTKSWNGLSHVGDFLSRTEPKRQLTHRESGVTAAQNKTAQREESGLAVFPAALSGRGTTKWRQKRTLNWQ